MHMQQHDKYITSQKLNPNLKFISPAVFRSLLWSPAVFRRIAHVVLSSLHLDFLRIAREQIYLALPWKQTGARLGYRVQ